MISYLLTSAFLSWVGGGAYLLVRRWASLRQRRSLLHLIILGSLLLPLTAGSGEHLAPPERVAAYSFGLRLDPQALQQHCRCEQPNYAHRLHYRANAVLNLMLRYKAYLTAGILSGMGAVLLLLLGQLWYVRRLVRASVQRPVTVDGRTYCLLTPSRPLGAAAFWLGRAYIIWPAALDVLSPAERLAVLRHERSHLRQGNTIEAGLLLLIQCLWLLNPAFYLLRRELRRLSEYLADEAGSTALPSRQAYARLLLRLQAGQSLPLLPGFGARDLQRRIQRLLHGRSPRLTGPAWGLLVLVLALQVGLTAPVQAQVRSSLARLHTYATIYHKAPAQTSELIYCPDCDTICTPEEGGRD